MSAIERDKLMLNMIIDDNKNSSQENACFPTLKNYKLSIQIFLTNYILKIFYLINNE
jgi:hypothetical protein